MSAVNARHVATWVHQVTEAERQQVRQQMAVAATKLLQSPEATAPSLRFLAGLTSGGDDQVGHCLPPQPHSHPHPHPHPHPRLHPHPHPSLVVVVIVISSLRTHVAAMASMAAVSTTNSFPALLLHHAL